MKNALWAIWSTSLLLLASIAHAQDYNRLLGGSTPDAITFKPIDVAGAAGGPQISAASGVIKTMEKLLRSLGLPLKATPVPRNMPRGQQYQNAYNPVKPIVVPLNR